jgi:hypothetical protein
MADQFMEITSRLVDRRIHGHRGSRRRSSPASVGRTGQRSSWTLSAAAWLLRPAVHSASAGRVGVCHRGTILKLRSRIGKTAISFPERPTERLPQVTEPVQGGACAGHTRTSPHGRV